MLSPSIILSFPRTYVCRLFLYKNVCYLLNSIESKRAICSGIWDNFNPFAL